MLNTISSDNGCGIRLSRVNQKKKEEEKPNKQSKTNRADSGNVFFPKVNRPVVPWERERKNDAALEDDSVTKANRKGGKKSEERTWTTRTRDVKSKFRSLETEALEGKNGGRNGPAVTVIHQHLWMNEKQMPLSRGRQREIKTTNRRERERKNGGRLDVRNPILGSVFLSRCWFGLCSRRSSAKPRAPTGRAEPKSRACLSLTGRQGPWLQSFF